MSFGFSPNDIIGLITLTSRTYQGWRDACYHYTDITGTLDCLVLLLRRLETHVPAQVPSEPGFAQRQALKRDLATVIRGVRNTVDELDKLLDKFPSLSRSRSKNWERIRFGAKDLTSLRSRLTQHVSSISAFLNVVELDSIGRMDQNVAALPDVISQRVTVALGNFIDARDADNKSLRGGNAMTNYSNDEIDVWRQFRSECVKSGIKSNDLKKFEPELRRYIQTIVSEKQATDTKSTAAEYHGPPPSSSSLLESPRQEEEDYFYGRKVIERDRPPTRQRDSHREVRPRDDATDYSSDDSYEHMRKDVSGQYRKAHLAEGAIVGAAAGEILRQHRLSQWQDDSDRRRSALDGAFLAGLKGEMISRYRRSRSRRRRSESRLRSRSSSRGSRPSADEYMIPDMNDRHRDPEHRNRRIAQAGLAAAAFGISPPVERKSRNSRRKSRDELMQAASAAAAGPGGVPSVSLSKSKSITQAGEQSAPVVLEMDHTADTEQSSPRAQSSSDKDDLNTPQQPSQASKKNPAENSEEQTQDAGVLDSSDDRKERAFVDASSNPLDYLMTLPFQPIPEVDYNILKDLMSTLPFESRPTDVKTQPRSDWKLPPVPTPPRPPRLSGASAASLGWSAYFKAFTDYIRTFQTWDAAVIQRFSERSGIAEVECFARSEYYARELAGDRDVKSL